MEKLNYLIFIALAFLQFFVSNATAQTINPLTDIEYLGAFRLPNDTSGGSYDWSYGLNGMTFYPNGDTSNSDEYSGSLYAINHVYEQYVAEMSIPVPIKSKNLSDLNRATTLQNFSNVNNGTYSSPYMESEIAYLAKQGNQATDKLYISWNDWYNVSDLDTDRYGWCELNLSSPNTQGPWNLGTHAEVNPHTVGNFLFEIPKTWSDSYIPSKLLVTGKFREGGSITSPNGGGPGIYAFGPWNDGNPPAKEATLSHVKLLSYIGGHAWSCEASGDVCKVKDEWEGGAWIVAGNKSAVVLIGRKGFGDDFYGISPNGCSGKGYHNLGGYKPYMLFYDPKDLADVARGIKQPYEPQPYATLDCGAYAFSSFSLCSAGYSSAAYDRAHQLLYVAEPNVDGTWKDKAVIHVFRIKETEASKPSIPSNLKITP